MSLLRTAILVIVPYLAANTAHAQMTVVVRDISPDQSGLDATDPNGASGGRVNGLGVDRSTPARSYAASEWGGLFRSNDNGLTWTHLEGHVPTATWDVEVDPTNSNRVYATSFYDGRVNSRAGINVSTDGGATWTRPAERHAAGWFLHRIEASRAERLWYFHRPGQRQSSVHWNQLRPGGHDQRRRDVELHRPDAGDRRTDRLGRRRPSRRHHRHLR